MSDEIARPCDLTALDAAYKSIDSLRGRIKDDGTAIKRLALLVHQVATQRDEARADVERLRGVPLETPMLDGKPRWTDLIGIDPDYTDGVPVDEWLEAKRAALDDLTEAERLISWAGLMELLDEHWPADIFPTLEDDPERDASARIVSLLRWVDRLRAQAPIVLGDRLGSTDPATVLEYVEDAPDWVGP